MINTSCMMISQPRAKPKKKPRQKPGAALKPTTPPLKQPPQVSCSEKEQQRAELPPATANPMVLPPDPLEDLQFDFDPDALDEDDICRAFDKQASFGSPKVIGDGADEDLDQLVADLEGDFMMGDSEAMRQSRRDDMYFQQALQSWTEDNNRRPKSDGAAMDEDSETSEWFKQKAKEWSRAASTSSLKRVRGPSSDDLVSMDMTTSKGPKSTCTDETRLSSSTAQPIAIPSSHSASAPHSTSSMVSTSAPPAMNIPPRCSGYWDQMAQSGGTETIRHHYVYATQTAPQPIPSPEMSAPVITSAAVVSPSPSDQSDSPSEPAVAVTVRARPTRQTTRARARTRAREQREEDDDSGDDVEEERTAEPQALSARSLSQIGRVRGAYQCRKCSQLSGKYVPKANHDCPFLQHLKKTEEEKEAEKRETKWVRAVATQCDLRITSNSGSKGAKGTKGGGLQKKLTSAVRVIAAALRA